jgi:hypothetical protein
MVDVHDRPMAALLALHIERAHPVLPRVGKVHRVDRITRAGAAHQTPTAAMSSRRHRRGKVDACILPISPKNDDA